MRWMIRGLPERSRLVRTLDIEDVNKYMHSDQLEGDRAILNAKASR